jgi:hypothetical protein
MSAPECIRRQKRSYGAIIALSVDPRNPAWMFAGFRQGDDVANFEVPDLDLYSLLARYLVSAARARLAGAKDRQLTIWRSEDGGWQIESA